MFRRAGLDPGNLSRYERGIVSPPQDTAVLERIGRALGLKPRSASWSDLIHLSAIGGGGVPPPAPEGGRPPEEAPLPSRALKGKKISEGELVLLPRRSL